MHTLRELYSRKAIPGWLLNLVALLWKLLSVGSNLDFLLDTLRGSGWVGPVVFWLRDYGYWVLFLAGLLGWCGWRAGDPPTSNPKFVARMKGIGLSSFPLTTGRRQGHSILDISIPIRLYNESPQDTRLKGISAILLRKRALWFSKRIEPTAVHELKIDNPSQRNGKLPLLIARDHVDVRFTTRADLPLETGAADLGEYCVQLIIQAAGEPPAKLNLSPRSHPELFDSDR